MHYFIRHWKLSTAKSPLTRWQIDLRRYAGSLDYWGLTCLAIVLLKFTTPPVGWGWAALFAWVPLIIITQRYSRIHCMLSAALAGVAWTSDLPLALLSWGWQLPLLSVVLASLICASIAAILQWVKINSWLGIFTFPLIFTGFVYLGQTTIPAPIALSPLVIESFPGLIASSHNLGFYGIEFAIALINSMAASLVLFLLDDNFRRTFSVKSRLDALCLASTIIFVTILGTFVFAQQINVQNPAQDRLTLYALQPAISPQDAKRAGNSLYQQKKNESRLDELTKIALKSPEPGLVIWPEGGHNFPNLGVKRRRDIMSSWLEGSHSEVIFSGYEYDSTGKRFNTVTHLNSQGFGKSVAKNRTAPLAESYLSRGQADVIHSRFGKIGIAICYEGIFTEHFRILKERGAQLFLVVTDDSSFGKTYLYRRHLNYARVNSAIYQTPTLFLNNYGPSFLIDANGKIKEIDMLGDYAHINHWQIPLRQNSDPENIRPHIKITILLFLIAIFFVVIFLVTAFLKRNDLRRPKIHLPRSNLSSKNLTPLSLKLSSMLALILLLLVPFDLYLNAAARGIELRSLWKESQNRFFGEAPLDALAPVFKQQQQSSCGAAALGYALTRMGDSIFEYDITTDFPAHHSDGYSLAELRRIANIRGFESQAQRVEIQDLPDVRKTPVIALMKGEQSDAKHYVTVLHKSRDEVVYFDPAHGEVFHTGSAAFSEKWTNIILTLNYHDRWFKESRLKN